MYIDNFKCSAAASARLCVETQSNQTEEHIDEKQPPPRGCVLKQLTHNIGVDFLNAAASARLCVETAGDTLEEAYIKQPPPRGCVLKPLIGGEMDNENMQPPPRGCVLKLLMRITSML